MYIEHPNKLIAAPLRALTPRSGAIIAPDNKKAILISRNNIFFKIFMRANI
jgi:hypothetical protein